jgi:hypothetical protein
MLLIIFAESRLCHCPPCTPRSFVVKLSHPGRYIKILDHQRRLVTVWPRTSIFSVCNFVLELVSRRLDFGSGVSNLLRCTDHDSSTGTDWNRGLLFPFSLGFSFLLRWTSLTVRPELVRSSYIYTSHHGYDLRVVQKCMVSI